MRKMYARHRTSVRWRFDGLRNAGKRASTANPLSRRDRAGGQSKCQSYLSHVPRFSEEDSSGSPPLPAIGEPDSGQGRKDPLGAPRFPAHHNWGRVLVTDAARRHKANSMRTARAGSCTAQAMRSKRQHPLPADNDAVLRVISVCPLHYDSTAVAVRIGGASLPTAGVARTTLRILREKPRLCRSLVPWGLVKFSLNLRLRNWHKVSHAFGRRQHPAHSPDHPSLLPACLGGPRPPYL